MWAVVSEIAKLELASRKSHCVVTCLTQEDGGPWDTPAGSSEGSLSTHPTAEF